MFFFNESIIYLHQTILSLTYCAQLANKFIDRLTKNSSIILFCVLWLVGIAAKCDVKSYSTATVKNAVWFSFVNNVRF